MAMHVHEVHAAVIHAPLALLPAAAAVDLVAAAGDHDGLHKAGRKLWWMAVGAGAFAGVAGLAASQEIKANDRQTEDMMWLHGIGNTAILLAGVGMAVWRTFRRPSLPQALTGLAASGLAMYTAYLGGEMVYGQGVGVRAMPGLAPTGVAHSEPVLSARAPGMFLRDAVRGLGWLMRRTSRALTARQPVARRALRGSPQTTA